MLKWDGCQAPPSRAQAARAGGPAPGAGTAQPRRSHPAPPQPPWRLSNARPRGAAAARERRPPAGRARGQARGSGARAGGGGLRAAPSASLSASLQPPAPRWVLAVRSALRRHQAQGLRQRARPQGLPGTPGSLTPRPQPHLCLGPGPGPEWSPASEAPLLDHPQLLTVVVTVGESAGAGTQHLGCPLPPCASCQQT